MWMAREPLRRVVWQAFFITGRLFGRWGLWLGEHGRAARLATAEKIIAHRAEELIDRMVVLEDRIGKRAQDLPKETEPVVARLDSAAHILEGKTEQITAISIEDAADRSMRAALPRIEEGRGLNKVEREAARAGAQALRAQLQPVRPSLMAIKAEAIRIGKSTAQLVEIEKRFSQGVEQVNKAFADFEECLHSEDRVKVAGKASIIIPWLIAVLITGIALSGVMLNYFLIERPMAEIVGEGSKIAGIGLPAFAAMIVIFLEFVAGVILMDALGFTKLIPAFHTMSDGARRGLAIAAALFLLTFSVLEVSLAFVRERIIELNAETLAIAGSDAAPGATGETTTNTADSLSSISTFAQAILAFVIPWLLATAALPLETIVRNSVFMIQLAGAYLMLGLSFVCKTVSNVFKSLGLFALTVYDLIIFAPLWIERKVKGMPTRGNDDNMKPPKRDRDREDLDLTEPAPRKKGKRDEAELELKRA